MTNEQSSPAVACPVERHVKEPKKKSEWMKGFVLGQKATDADIVKFESIQRLRDFESKLLKRK